MPTTTNYGWTTPADTDLVKNGASAIRTLGTAIDTTVFNNASAAIAKTIVDAKGDLIAATAADTVARLAVGSNNQVLTCDSAEATGLKWATPASGGKVLQVVYASTSTNVSISSTTYTDTNITATITPSAASSKVLILIGINAQCGITGNIQGFSQKLLRGSTSIFDVDGTTQAQDSGLVEIGGASSITLIARTGFDYLDSPSTTSAITYKVQARPRSTSGGGYLNVNNNGASSHITLLEIGA